MTSDRTPRPEGQWTWRRAYVYVLTLLLLGLLAWTIPMIPAPELRRVADGVLAVIIVLSVLYLIAPSAAELIRLLAEVRAFRAPPPSPPDVPPQAGLDRVEADRDQA